MKRWCAKVALFLLLGAIINVAVAWGCARWSHFESSLGRRFAPDKARLLWAEYAPQTWTMSDNAQAVSGVWMGVGLTRFRVGDGLTPLSHDQVLFGLDTDGDGLHQLCIFECGWPVRSLRETRALSLAEAVLQMRRDYELDRNIDASWKDFHPLLLATFANSAFYALTLWGLTRAALALHRLSLPWIARLPRGSDGRIQLLTGSRCLLLAALLLAAVITNVAVAWICAAYSGTRDVSQPYPQVPVTTEDLLALGHHPDLIRTQKYLGVQRRTLIESVFMGLGPGAFEGSYSDQVVSVATHAGWPCHALQGVLKPNEPNPFVLNRRRTLDQYDSPALLPTTVSVGGFAINTGFYAAILWPLFAAPFVWRRRRRIKRGLCAVCAYPVGESSVCTECGKKMVPARRTVR